MDDVIRWMDLAVGDVVHQFDKLIDYLPQLIGGLLLLVVGWLAARIVRALVIRIVGGWDWLIQKITIGKLVSQANARQTFITVAGNVSYWLTILFFLTAAAHTLNLEAFSYWLDRAILYIPTIISGAIILFLSFIFGNYVREALPRRLSTATGRQRELLAGAARAAIVIAGLVVALDLVGIDTSIVVTVVGIGVGMFLGSAALAFGLGARTFVSNVIGARHVRREVNVGDMIRVGSTEGRILSIGQSAITVETSEGRALIPGKVFSEQSSLIVQQDFASE